MSFDLNQVLQVAIKGGASDIHVKAGLPPMFRVNGQLLPLRDAARLTPEEIAKTALSLMTAHQQATFKQRHDVDFAYGLPGVGRFRVNVFQQRNAVGMVLRVIPYKIQTIDSLGLPESVKRIADNRRGLILVTGTTGSGKSTTLAAIIEHINTTRSDHIITIEDPIEFLIRDKRSVVNQREVGTDCESFASALRAALRQDPDVMLVGEMRDLETIEIGLTAAETGHLVLATLHTTDCAETISRLVNVFPPHQQHTVRLGLSGMLKGVISQRLVPTVDGGRIPAVEVMMSTARIRELIADENRQREIREALEAGKDTYGMQSFDQSLLALLNAGRISYEEAIAQTSNPDDFALKVSGIDGSAGGGGAWEPTYQGSGNAPEPTFDFDDF
ncbi:MAG: type IV pilus twitching motility protein PilT [Myxococcales bacterium]|nr:type IV pilus twitching motility protein PilT [Myxococcales bacterium]MCB9519309.1 type IV pilus twitching motility protein PilT [Myxococcales bacterium]MCB9530753.1 type IV pilus twitching motility protein PilT [Myxococcales bacterium]MCB9533353.1 type IV pilus twitching motility protein PilT [Myxococcales bacterium]